MRFVLDAHKNLPRLLAVAMGALVFAAAAHATTITRTTNYEYEPVTGLLTAQIVEPGSTSLHLRSDYSYNAFGQLTITQLSSTATGLAAIPARTASTVQYDANGLAPVSVTNALGQVVYSTNNASNLPLSVTDLNGLVTTWTYDGFDRKTKEQRPDGAITTWSYLVCGGAVPCSGFAKYVITKNEYLADGVTANGPWSKIYMDSLDRPVRMETLGFDGVSVMTVDTEYDALGRVSRTSRPYYPGAAIKWVTNGYDAVGRPTSVTSPDGSQITTSYNGLVTAVTNALGQTQTALRNSLGQVVKVTDTQNNSLLYEYDPQGNLTKTTDPKGNAVTMAYDVAGHKISMVDPDLGSWTYAYDALGELVKQTSANGQSSTLNYDLLGRPTSRAEADLVSSWVFDSCTKGVGKLCRASSDNGYVCVAAYDSLGRLTGNATTIGTTFSIARTFDANGRVATQTYPTGLTLKNVYTAYGYLKEVRNNATNAMYWQANAMDAEGHLTQQTYGNGIVTQQVFDANTGRTLSIVAGAGNAVQNLAFTYDARGNMLTRSDANQSLSETFLYDSLNRLTSNTVNSGGAGVVTQTYGYDSIGNVTSRSDLGAYTYGAVNAKPHAVQQIALAGGGTRQFTYDLVGNLVSEVQKDAANNVIASKGRTETYTSFNMPVTLASPAATLSFVYGPDHQRIKQVSPTATTIYLHPDNAGGLLYEKDIRGDGTALHKHYLTAGGAVVALIKQVDAGALNVLYMHSDPVGSVTAVSDGAGAVIERMAYEPFGKRRTPAGALDPNGVIVGVNTDRGYTNHEELDELGLIHMNGRVFDPVSARFLSADSGVPYPTNIQSYNRYSYARNNPLIMIDPSGFEERVVPGGGLGFIDRILQFFGLGGDGGGGNGPGGASEPPAPMPPMQTVVISAPMQPMQTVVITAPKGYYDPTGCVASNTCFSGPISSYPDDLWTVVNQRHPPTKITDDGCVSGGKIAICIGPGSLGKVASPLLTIGAGRLAHIFRNALGHVNPASVAEQEKFVELFQKVASDSANLNPAIVPSAQAAKAGVQGFSQFLSSGEQVWVLVKDNEIINAGINQAGKVR